MTKPSVVLSMIVKNEAPVIRRCLESVKPWITTWAICDTGSTDGTQDIIREVLKDIPGTLEEKPWRDFASNRNEALELARKTKAEWTLIIDADEELIGPTDCLENLSTVNTAACFFSLDISPEASWVREILIKTSLEWKYVGEIQELLTCSSEKHVAILHDVTVCSHTDGARNRDGAHKKWQRDADTLKKLLKKDPNNTRNLYYYGQTLLALGEIDKAIEVCEKRATLAGFQEEVYMSLFTIALMKQRRCDHWQDVVLSYQKAYEARPIRAEPLFQIASLYASHNQLGFAELILRQCVQMKRPLDTLMVQNEIYEWRSADLFASVLCGLGKYEEALSVIDALCLVAPKNDLPRLQGNIEAIKAAMPK